MGKKDVVLARYFEDEERYADLINAFVFQGEQVVGSGDIAEMDTRVTGAIGRIRRRFEVLKYRDLIRRVALGAEFVLIGLENQDKVHYAMPVRVMLQDSAGYDRQLRRKRREYRGRSGMGAAEFLSGFLKQDRLYPVFTLVLYYGKEPWDGARELYELMDYDNLPERLRKMLNNYRIHVLEVRRFAHIERFRTDLHDVFGFIRYAGDKDAERQFTEDNRNSFEAMDEEAYDVISTLTGSAELEAAKEQYREEGGKINMCEAIRGMIEDGKMEGRREGVLLGKREGLLLGKKEGLLLGRQQGALEKTKAVARNMYLRGMSAEDAAAICEVDAGLVRQWFEGWDS